MGETKRVAEEAEAGEQGEGSAVEVQLPSIGGEDELPVSVAMKLLREGSALVVAETPLPLGCVLEEQGQTVVVTEVTDGACVPPAAFKRLE